MKKVIVSYMLLMLCATVSQTAAADDFGTWLGIGAEKTLGSRWSIGADAEWRIADRVSAGVSAAYKPVKWLKLQGGYELQDVRSEGGLSSSGKYYNDAQWHLRHRFYGDVTGTLKTGRWKLSLRERLTYTTAPSYDRTRTVVNTERSDYGTVSTKTVESKSSTVLRTRLAAEYSIPHCALTPYASVEMYNNPSVQKMRYTAGAEYKINKRQSLKMYYLFQDRKTQDDDDEPAIDQHVVGASWNIKF
jgi:hypothetical protein